MLKKNIIDDIPSPCFVLERDKLIGNLELLKYVQEQSGATIILALKGFSMYSEFELVKEYLGGATASSLNEALLINEEMGLKSHTYSPAYIPSEFGEVQALSSHLTFNSLSQFELYKSQLSNEVSYGLRINPQYAEVETQMYNPCIPGSRLGITADLLQELPPEIEGLHCHTLCENGADVLERTLVHIESKFGKHLNKIKWLNLGGGHLITRKGYDVELLISLIKRLKSTYQIEVILEPGSAIGWQTGFLKSTVLDIINSQGEKVALLDVSFAAHMPDTLEMPYYPRVLNAKENNSSGPYVYTLGGSTCLAGDYIGKYSFENELKVGDTLIFDDMIHYTMVKTTTFNGVKHPSIGVIDNDNFYIHKEFGYETFKQKL